jgi:hypothetical protein
MNMQDKLIELAHLKNETVNLRAHIDLQNSVLHALRILAPVLQLSEGKQYVDPNSGTGWSLHNFNKPRQRSNTEHTDWPSGANIDAVIREAEIHLNNYSPPISAAEWPDIYRQYQQMHSQIGSLVSQLIMSHKSFGTSNRRRYVIPKVYATTIGPRHVL